mgnify:CR=1 FL=1
MVINMKNFGKKTRFSLLIYSELIAGILCYVLVAAVTGLLIWSAINSEERIDDIVTVIIILAVFYLLCAVGGGWLISLPAYMLAVLPVHNAIGTNKLSSAMGTTLTTVRYARDGFIPWKQAVFCVIFALIGSACGAELALMLDADVFKIIMLFILPVTAIYVFKSKALVTEKPPLSFTKTTVLSCAIALVIGAYDGFYGPGTGTFLILLLTAAAHMPLTSANGVSKVINLTTNISALTVFILSSKVLYPLGLAAGVFSIAGNLLGAKHFEKGGGKTVKPIMILVLTIFFIKVL